MDSGLALRAPRNDGRNMTLKLFELVGTDPSRPFSPYCWRTRMALAHKGLAAETIPWRFTEKGAIAPYKSEKVPVLLDGDKAIVDSWEIANYLEDAYPDRPSLFGGEGGRAAARFLNGWGDMTIIAGIFPMIIADVPSRLGPEDQAYFRKTREARFNKVLEEVSADRDSRVEGFRQNLDPLASDAADAAVHRRQRAELRRLHRVRRFSCGRGRSARSAC